MRVFFRLLAQHLILLTVLVFLLTGLLLREPIFGLSGGMLPGLEAGGAAPPPAAAAVPAADIASAEAAPPGFTTENHRAGSPDRPVEPPTRGESAPPVESPPGAQEASMPVPAEAPPSLADRAPLPLDEPAASAAAQAGPSGQVPQYLSGEPVSSSGYSFRPLDQGSGEAPLSAAPEGEVQGPIAQSADAGPAVVPPSDQPPTGVEPASAGADRLGVPPSEPSAENGADNRLNEARRAFWEGDMDRAHGLYQALAGEQPDNPDLFGELGNFYYQTGKAEDAAQAYATAAVKLLGQGRRPEAKALVETVRSLDPQEAADLARRLGE